MTFEIPQKEKAEKIKMPRQKPEFVEYQIDKSGGSFAKGYIWSEGNVIVKAKNEKEVYNVIENHDWGNFQIDDTGVPVEVEGKEGLWELWIRLGAYN